MYNDIWNTKQFDKQKIKAVKNVKNVQFIIRN